MGERLNSPNLTATHHTWSDIRFQNLRKCLEQQREEILQEAERAMGLIYVLQDQFDEKEKRISFRFFFLHSRAIHENLMKKMDTPTTERHKLSPNRIKRNKRFRIPIYN